MTNLQDLDPQATALIVIDMQRDFCSPGGYAHQAGLDIARMQAVVGQVKALLVAARAAGLHVFHTREGHLPDLSDCPPAKLARSVAAGAPIGRPGPLGRLLVRGEQGHDFVPEQRPQGGLVEGAVAGLVDHVFARQRALLGAFGIRRLLLCGVTTEVCVHSTLREAVDRGLVCTTVGDATAASQAELQAPALAMIGVEGGIFGGVCSTAEAVDALNALPRANREAA